MRLAPELDGFEVLYSNQHGHPKVGQELFSVNILFWALLDNGAFVGMIPWFDELIICTDLNCPSKGFFQGYYDPGLDQIIPQVPGHKCIELITAADYFQGSFRCKSPADGKESVVVYDYAPERFVSVVYDYCERVAEATNTTAEKVISNWLEVSDVYDYDGNAWNVLTGSDISKRFLADISNHIDRIGSCINQQHIDDAIIALLQHKSKDSNSNSSRTQLNANDIDEGKNKENANSNMAQPKTNDENELEVTMQRIRYSLKQIYKLADIAWANDLEFEKIQDVVELDDDIVSQVTGLTIAEWSAIMNTVNTVSANRALGQYYDYQ